MPSDKIVSLEFSRFLESQEYKDMTTNIRDTMKAKGKAYFAEKIIAGLRREMKEEFAKYPGCTWDQIGQIQWAEQNGYAAHYEETHSRMRAHMAMARTPDKNA